MGSGHIFFDPSSCHGNMLFLGNGDPVFRGPRSTMMKMEDSSKRRPFFSSPEDLYDEEYYDEQSPEKKRRLTPEQVVSLMEKLQGKVVGGAGVSEKSEVLEVDAMTTLQVKVKAEDRLSSGSGGSAVVDEHSPQLVDSGDSYFHTDHDEYPGPGGCNIPPPVDGLQSEEDDGSDDGSCHGYFSNVFVAEEQHNEEGEEPVGWFWS